MPGANHLSHGHESSVTPVPYTLVIFEIDVDTTDAYQNW